MNIAIRNPVASRREEGSLQVELDPALKIGTAKVFAVYGKGGIGKSTTSSNLSVAFSKLGKRVLQIGCDPKHDSTFTLTKRLAPTVIDALEAVQFHSEELRIEDFVAEGYNGVMCVEAGGPRGHRLRWLRGRPDGEAPQGASPSRRHRRGHLRRARRRGLRRLRLAAPACRPGADRHRQRLRFDLRHEPDRGRDPFEVEELSGAAGGVIANRSAKTDEIDRFNAAVGLERIAHFPDLDVVRRSRLKKSTLFEMEPTPELIAVTDEYMRLAAHLWAGGKPLSAMPMKDRDLFEFLGFD